MIIFIDVSLREIHVYSENGLKRIPFHDAHILETIVGKQKINYITNVLETNAKEVVNLVRGISEQQLTTTRSSKSFGPDLEEIIKQAEYLHSVSKGTLLVSDIDIRFTGSADCKLIDNKMKEKIKKSRILQNLIKKGTVEIIGEDRKISLLAEWRQDMKKTIAKQSARDEALDNILMNEKVGGGHWNGTIADGGTAMEIDVGRRGIGSEDSHGAATMSELQSMIDGTN